MIRSAQVQNHFLTTDGTRPAPGVDYDGLAQRIVNAANPIAPSDAVTLDYLTSTPTVDVWRQLDLPSAAGQQGYTLPLNNYFHFGSSAPIGLQTRVYVDQGAGFNEIFYGPDYSHIRRSSNSYLGSYSTQFDTVQDMAFGISISGGVVAAGWTIRIEWLERRSMLSVPPIAIIRYPSDYTVPWFPVISSVTYPNAVTLAAPPPGWQIEFWRQTFMAGGVRGVANPSVTNGGNIPGLRRKGRRFVPYFRGETNRTIFNVASATTMAPLLNFPRTKDWKKKKFKVCYYDPQTGARTGLSTETIVVAQRRTLDGDRNKGGSAGFRASQSVWIE